MTGEIVPSIHLQSLLENVAKRQGFVEPRFDFSTATKPGDNFLGLLYRVTVSDDAEDGKTLSLIVKTIPLSRKRREMMQSHAYFRNEAVVYKTVFPGFAEFLRERGELASTCRVFPSTPRCYEVQTDSGEDGVEGDENILVLQDLRPLGFVMTDRGVPMDVHHLRLVMRKLAEMHATSFAMEKLQPDKFAKLRAGLKENMFASHNPIQNSLRKLGTRALDFIKRRFPEGSVGYQKAEEMLSDAFESMRQTVLPDPEGGNAFMHGDCWANNVLFKFSEPEHRPEDLCFLDFQWSRYGPPVVDLMYLVYVSTERPLRQEHYQGLLRDYHSHLIQTADRLVGEPGAGAQLYSWETMQRQLKRSGRYGFGIAALFLILYMVDGKDAKDPDACFEDGSATDDMFMATVESPERDDRLADILQDMIDLGYM